ncbi:histidine kinase [hydrothermal vent metagenome]|uniref:Histidine kinase n=1 Tax=hydrothermal vent metagenome TaxID=652676 RepID=A0A1W1EJV1_9ZZZZ
MKLNKIFSLNYHPKLIIILNDASFLGALASNILGMLFALHLLSDTMEDSYKYSLAIFSISIFITRVYTSYISTKYIRKNNRAKPIYLMIIFLTIILTAIFYSIVLWWAVLYEIDDISIFLIATIILSLIAGSSSSMSSIFVAFLLYISSNIISLIPALLYHGGEPFYIYAFIISVFIIVVIQSGYKHFNALKDSIELKEKFEHRVNEELEKNRQKDKQLLQQTRLAQMGEMISLIAHQWRQPLSAISSRVNAIDIKIEFGTYNLDNVDERNKFIEYMNEGHKHILNYVSSLSETINDFRTFFKPDKNKEFITITTPIERALSIVEIKMSNHNIEIIKDYRIDKHINMLSNEIMQVVLIILNNAEDNFEERNINNREITIITKEDDKHYIIEIKDTGGGVPNDILDKIFEPYFTTKDSEKGTGLGLYMSKTIVEEHNNGILSVKNIDNGVSFEIKLKKEEIR